MRPGGGSVRPRPSGRGKNPKSTRTHTDLIFEAAECLDANKVDQAKRQPPILWRLSSATTNGHAYSWEPGFEDLPSEEQLVVAWPIPAQSLEITRHWWCHMPIAECRSNFS